MADTENTAASTEPPTDTAALGLRGSITGPAWLLAFMPVITVGLAVLAGIIAVAGFPATPHWSLVGVPLVAYPLTVLVALGDIRQLHALRHPRVASWRWSLLGAPLYLIMRTRALRPVRRSGWAPMWVAVGTAVAITAVNAPFVGRLIYGSLLGGAGG
jgi:hypothetical protein